MRITLRTTKHYEVYQVGKNAFRARRAKTDPDRDGSKTYMRLSAGEARYFALASTSEKEVDAELSLVGL